MSCLHLARCNVSACGWRRRSSGPWGGRVTGRWAHCWVSVWPETDCCWRPTHWAPAGWQTHSDMSLQNTGNVTVLGFFLYKNTIWEGRKKQTVFLNEQLNYLRIISFRKRALIFLQANTICFHSVTHFNRFIMQKLMQNILVRPIYADSWETWHVAITLEIKAPLHHPEQSNKDSLSF